MVEKRCHLVQTIEASDHVQETLLDKETPLCLSQQQQQQEEKAQELLA